jgi:hypothetical protein
MVLIWSPSKHIAYNLRYNFTKHFGYPRFQLFQQLLPVFIQKQIHVVGQRLVTVEQIAQVHVEPGCGEVNLIGFDVQVGFAILQDSTRIKFVHNIDAIYQYIVAI